MKSSIVTQEHGFLVRQSAKRTLGLAVASAIMALTSLWIGCKSFWDAALPFWLVLVQSPVFLLLQLGGILSAIISIYLVKRYRTGKAVLIVNDDGVTDNSSLLSFGFIPWADIVGMHMGEVQGQRLIELAIADEDAYLRRLPRWRQKLIQMNFGMGHELVCITLNTTGISPEEVFAQMQAYFVRSHPL